MATTTISARQHWWWWGSTRGRLAKWVKALLQGRRYTIKVKPYQTRNGVGTGYHDPVSKVIQANPQFFAEESSETQFRATQGILAHEVGHAFFTSAWPGDPGKETLRPAQDTALRWLVNALEDQRIENALSIYYPGLAPLIRLLGDLMVVRGQSLAGRPPAEQALACCLDWRWAFERDGEAEMLARLGIKAEESLDLWQKVKPLVEGAWTVENTHKVIEIAGQILEILDLPEGYSLPDLPLFKWMVGEDVPAEQDSDTDVLPFPVSAFDGESPGTGTGCDDQSLPDPKGDDISQPAPYAELEQAAAPLARQLAEALKVPQPYRRPLPHEWRGRYSFRQEVRTPATPNLHRLGVARDKENVVFYVLVDRSGSMGVIDEQVRLALMTLYLAASELRLPLGIAFFGHDSSSRVDRLVLEVTPIHGQLAEEPKALIAGYHGRTRAEYLDWGLALAGKALLSRPERRKVLLVLHDGEPVYSGDLGNDYQLSLERLRRLERQGITPIGLYLGERGMVGFDPNHAQLEALFPRLVITSGERLPEKLGGMLRSLA